MERRAFVKSGALALVTIGLSPSFLRRTAFGMELVNAPKGKVLICLFQRGAADALNIVVPHGERAYYAMRPSIAIPQPSSNAIGGAIDLDGFFGLHPALAPLKAATADEFNARADRVRAALEADASLARVAAIGLGLPRGRLAADHRDVVVEAEVPRRVVVGDEGAPRGQVPGEIWDLRPFAESGRGVLVLEDDDENVVVVRQVRGRGRGPDADQREGGDEGEDEEPGHRARRGTRRRAPGPGHVGAAAPPPGRRWWPRPCAGCRRRPRG